MLGKEKLEDLYGKVWSTDELTKDFEVVHFFAPFVRVISRISRKKGTVQFQHSPRFYFDFRED